MESLKARKRALNNLHNVIKTRYNSGDRSAQLQRNAAIYSVLKQQDRNMFGIDYSRNSNVTPADLETSLAYIKSKIGKTAGNEVLRLRNTPGAMGQLINLELASGRNVFANFKPVAPKTFRQQLNELKISNEELEELRAGLNEAAAAPPPAPAPAAAAPLAVPAPSFSRFRLSPEEQAMLEAEMNNLREGLNNNNNTASTTSTGSFESAKSKGGRRSTKKNLKRKRNTRRRK